MAQDAGISLYANINYIKTKGKINLSPLAVYLGS